MISTSRTPFLICFISFIRANEVDRLLKIINDNFESGKKWTYPEKNTDFSENVSGTSENFGSFDFVIVGAGSGGATLARRLSEHNKWRILLLEAGGNETEFSIMPASTVASETSDINWGYLTTPQKGVCLSAINNQCSFPRGKVLGGCSSINGIIYARGVLRDFENWVRLGNSGWSSDKVLCYFRKSEKAHFRGDNNYTGYTGPQNVDFNKPIPQIIQNLFKGYNELGYPTLRDYNGKSSIGISLSQNILLKGKRNSANQAFLKPVLRRNNLKVLTRALATKVIFNADRSVKELQFLHKIKSYFVNPKLELVLAAGSINTPQLLMLSGIGPRKHLESLNIRVIADLPVGQNLVDHAIVFMFMIQNNATVIEYTLRQQVEQYIQGYGPLTSSVAYAVHFLQTNKSLPKNYPDIETSFGLPNFNFPTLTLKAFNFKDNVQQYLSSLKRNTIIANIALLHPKSTGTITLKSAKPTDFPLLDINWFSHPDDIKTISKGISMSLEVINTPAMRRINASLETNTILECRDLNETERFACHARHLTFGGHPIGTCRMGRDERTSVVNENLQVHGIKKLRIVDASVMPSINSGHLHAAVVMVAEKAADDLKKFYLQQVPTC